MRRALLSILAWFLGLSIAGAAEKPARRTPKEALQAFNHLIGEWKGTGTPAGTREQREKGPWTEHITWAWGFKKDQVWLKVTFAKSKHFSGGELHYLPEKNLFRLTVTTPAKETLTFTGKLNKRRLVLERTDPKTKEGQALAFTFLRPNRFLYAFQKKPQSGGLYTRVYLVGANRKGVPFAVGDGRPECVVSGGLGRIKVTFQDKTYYVCCTGCRDEFNDHPEKYIKEYEKKLKAKKEKGARK
jgi:hypothetical protein